MVPRTAAKNSTAAPAKKVKSSGASGAKKKLTAYNKFMRSEMARLKETEPGITHKERFSKATNNWKTSKENPKNA